MAVEKEIELLDDFLANRMNAEEKAAFEKRLESDPELSREYTHQQKLIEGIRQARIAELKNMLSNTTVPPVQPGRMVLTKIASWVVVAALIGTGLYFFLKPEQETKSSSGTATEEAPERTASEPIHAEGKTSEQPVETHEIQVNKDKEEVKSVTPKQTVKQPESPSLNVFDPTEDSSATSIKDEPVITTPEKARDKSSIIVENITGSKNYNFHYQFEGGKLLLYGSFEKNLYEILEFFSDNKRTLFLYYKENYYLLSEESDRVQPLTPIHDTQLLKKLKASREN